MAIAQSVALVGMMGAGKTSVGQHLAVLTELPFLDMDAEIEKAANMTVAEIFSRDGETFFRDRETQVLERLLEGPACILSTGGGTFLRPRNRDLIAARSVSVWLRAEVDVLWARVKDKTTRPLLQEADPYATLARLDAERRAAYEQADFVVESHADRKSTDVAAAVFDLVQSNQQGA